MKEVSPSEAYDLMEKDPEYIYLDVRSVPEYEAGHPVRAINIPLLHATAGGMVPNDDFIGVVEANVPKDAKVVIGCKSGGRSARACQMLSQIGYENVANVRGGFHGAADAFGQVSEPGWSMLNLPTCGDCKDEKHYSSLASRAGK
ncbi:MAG TPA: rhodanese-like domain-containing protein [Blastocatellia bacterium]|nr:rhodanese-like domain-containing protein [Blastocatellia bacterium]